MAGGPQKKATKKFEKKHLQGELERRRAAKKSKQKHQQAEKKRERQAKEHRSHERVEDGAAEVSAPKPAQASLQDMTVDDFFQGGFELPEPKSKKRKRSGASIRNGSTIHPPAKASAEDGGAAAASDDSSVAEHKHELEALAKQDPGFYKYLKENDAELLDFDVPAGPQDSGSESEGAFAGGEDEPQRATPVSSAMIKQWRAALKEKHSLPAVKEVLIAFRAAAHSDEDEASEQKYAIDSPEVFHDVLVLALQHVPEVLQHHIPIKYNAGGKTRLPADSKKYKAIAGPLTSHINAIVQLLGTLSDKATLKLTLSSLEPLLPYMLLLKKPLKNLLKSIVSIWSNATYDETVRINAFLLMRRTTAIADAAVTESVLKATYQGLVRGSRNTTAWTLPAINLMKNSAVELWGLDGDLGYTTGFSSIRQLAVHLRGSIAHPTKESYKAIYNWQYVHSLDFWSRVLSTHCSPAANAAIKAPTESALHPLIYPLVQITLGAVRLQCTPAYFPLRFQLVQALLRLSRATHTYIPLAPVLLEVLQSPELRRPAQASTARPVDFRVALRAPKSLLRTRVYQDGVGAQVVELLAEFFGIWAKNIAFPELIIPPSVVLKRWLKETGGRGSGAKDQGPKGKTKRGGNANPKLHAAITLLVAKLLANGTWVARARSRVDYAVSNRAAVATFLQDVPPEDTPLGAYVATLRRQRADQERLLEQSREDDRRREREGRKDGDDGLEGEEIEEEGEEEEDGEEDGDEVEEEDEGEDEGEDGQDDAGGDEDGDMEDL